MLNKFLNIINFSEYERQRIEYNLVIIKDNFCLIITLLNSIAGAKINVERGFIKNIDLNVIIYY
jgi:hypothetical protein